MHSNENTPNANLELARAYLRAIENRAGEEELESFFSPDVVVEQFPNRLVPNLVKSSLADVKRESEMGKKSVARQSYTVRNAVAAGEWVAMQVDWERGCLPFLWPASKPEPQYAPISPCSFTSATERSCTRATTTASSHGKPVMVMLK